MIRLTRKIIKRIDRIRELLETFGPMTVRQLYYQFKPEGLNYEQVRYGAGRGRLAGLIPFHMIKDRSRPSYGLYKFRDLNEYLEEIRGSFFLDYWIDSPYKLEIWSEKDALSQILYEEASKYRVPVRVTRGFLSTTKKWEWGKLGSYVLYFGDFDPSGLCMDEGLEKSLLMHFKGFDRVSLTLEQAETYDLPSVPLNRDDKRSKAYEEKYGDRGWELDAVPPDKLRELVRMSIEEKLTFNLDKKRKEEEQIREQIKTLVPSP